MLKLLEDHHRRLADVIKTRNTFATQLSNVGDPLLDKVEVPGQASSHATTTTSSTTVVDPATHPARPSTSAFSKMQQQRRDSSPALAKDMASRRGIPQPHQRKITPPIADGKPAGSHDTPEASKKKPGSKHREIVEAPSASQADLKNTTPAEEGFSRFYSNLTSGPFSKISSMLAFAALPLTEPPSQPSSPTSSRSEKSSATAHAEPDFKALISPAAMKALEEHQRRRGHGGQTFGPGESFYVVPTSGGTVSYANIARAEQRYARRQQGHLDNITEEDNDFIDARETQHLRNTASAAASHGRAGSLTLPNHRAEELELENETLKQVLDKLSHRLQAFERSAQDASMAALTQSMASVRTDGGGRADEAGMSDKERVMEVELQKAAKEKEIAKLKSQNQKYKDYLEKLRMSARQKTKEKKESIEGAA